MSEPEATHVMLIADSISSSVHGANSPLKLGSNIFEHGSAELNLKLPVSSIFTGSLEILGLKSYGLKLV